MGAYFNLGNLTTPVVTRVDKTVDFGWLGVSPAPGVNGSQFAVQWNGYVRAPATGFYTFSLSSNGWTRMWINNVLVIDRPQVGAGSTSCYLNLTGGVKVPIRIQYASDPNAGMINLAWNSPLVPWQIVPRDNLYSVPFSSVTSSAPAS